MKPDWSEAFPIYRASEWPSEVRIACDADLGPKDVRSTRVSDYQRSIHPVKVKVYHGSYATASP